MSVHKVWPYISFYDINCKFGPHFHKVAAECGRAGMWSHPLASWASELHMPLPPFHRYMHSAACAAQHALDLLPAAGIGVGEPTEVLNRYLGIAGTVLQYATRAVRAVWLEVLLQAWQLKKENDLPKLLWRMWCKARVQQSTSSAEQAQLWKQALDAGADVDEVCVQGERYKVHPAWCIVVDTIAPELQQYGQTLWVAGHDLQCCNAL
jgi:hypothetical protein